ncbi:MAG TPA: hypothetical protein VFS08_19590, partial [Gemmatimonadaceae bacterium]|nr:hypothetical protein [Gemmatimonadaceae bacterium]
MTLIELTVGLVVTGMVLAAGYGAFSSIVDHRTAVRRATLAGERAAALRETLDGWLAAGDVLVQRGGRPRAGGGIDSSAVADEIILRTTAPAFGDTPSTIIRLYVDDDPDTPARGLVAQYQVDIRDTLRMVELDSAVGGMRVEYLDRTTGRWVPSDEVATIQPRAIRVALLATAPDTLPALLRLPIERPIGIGAQQAANGGQLPARGGGRSAGDGGGGRG